MKRVLGILILTIAAFSTILGQTPEKKTDQTTKPQTPQKKTEPASQPQTPEKKTEPASQPQTPEKKAEPASQPQTPEKKAEQTSQPVGENVSATSSAEQELIALDKQWGEAGTKGDSAALEKLLADDFIGASATGVATKAQSIAQAKSDAANITNATYVADEYSVRFLDPNTAVMTHSAVGKGMNKGKEYTDHHRSMHVWVKRNGQWQVVASQATPIPEKTTP
jgi:hypothetical protein